METILSIEYFEHKCVILKELLQLQQPKKNMVTIGVYQYLINSALCEHMCLESIKKLCKYDGKCDNQQQYKVII